MKNTMKNIIILLLISVSIFSQKVDTIIHKTKYTSYFSYQVRIPLFVVYELYKGGGDVSREGMSFSTDGLNNSASSDDYSHNNYDKGHLVNAEDFAYNYDLEKETFFYYNAIPQTKELNRGIWKVFETSIRQRSQKNKLQIICGGYDFTNNVKMGNVSVPKYCFKIVKLAIVGKKDSINYYIFPNDKSDSYIETDQKGMFKVLPKNYQVIINKILF